MMDGCIIIIIMYLLDFDRRKPGGERTSTARVGCSLQILLVSLPDIQPLVAATPADLS